MSRAQAAIELTLIASLMLMVLFILFEFGETKIIESASVLQVSEARNTVDRLAKAAIEVRNEGVGARRKIYVTIPDRVNPDRILIGNYTITIGVYVKDNTSDISNQLTFPVVKGGYFPTTPGSYWVWVINKQGYVQIGSALGIEPLSVYSELLPNNSTTTDITFTNYGTSSINVSLSLVWADSEVGVEINGTTDLSFTLLTDTPNSQKISLNASAYSNASRGLHNGYLSVTTNISESELIPIIINIVASPPTAGGVSYLTIDTYNDSAYTNATAVFPLNQTLYYKIRSYNSTDGLVNSTVTVRIYDPLLTLLYQQTSSPSAESGVYNGSYTIPYSLPGLWKVTAYEVGGASTAMYFTTISLPDNTPPTYSLNSTDSTTAGTPVEHRLKWEDNIQLSGYTFQFCNGTWNGTDCSAFSTGLENFTTYTEVDPNNHLSQTATRATFTTLTYNEDAYLYKSYGSGHFSGDFEHKIDAVLSSSTTHNNYAVVWALANGVGDNNDIEALNDYIKLYFAHRSTGKYFWLDGKYNGAAVSNTSSTYALTLGKTYYLTIKRDGNVVTVNVYDESARTTLLTSLTITLAGASSFEYLITTGSTSGVSYTWTLTGFVENLDLQETPSLWLSGWTYRKSHNITNSTGAGVNYQINITVINGTGTDSGSIVYINNKMRSDFGDIRFTNSTGSLLDYWMENYTSGVNATFWVEVSGNLTSTNQTIYIYYGNSTATTTSNGTNTFLIFSNFDQASDTDGFDKIAYVYKGSNPYSRFNRIHNTTEGQSAPSMELDAEYIGAEGTGWVFFLSKNITKESDAELRISLDSRAKSDTPLSSVTNAAVYIHMRNDSYSDGTYIQGFSLVSGGTLDTGWITNRSMNTSNTRGNTSLTVGFGGSDAWGSDWHQLRWFDNIRVGKYIYPEPSHGSWGGEESQMQSSPSWVNDTWTAFTSGMCSTRYTECWSNVTKVVNNTVGATIAWCVYANDTGNNWNNSCSNPHTYTTTLATTLIDTAYTIAFYPNQRTICRDDSNYIHVVWRYNSTLIKYARSIDNGVSFTVSDLNNSPNTKYYPHISCNGNNIYIAFMNDSSIFLYKSTTNGEVFDLMPVITPVSYCAIYTYADDKVTMEARGDRIYIVYANGGYLCFVNSTDGGTTWSLPTDYIESELGTYTIQHPSLSVNGTGSSNDRIYIAYKRALNLNNQYTIRFRNSTDSGVTWGTYTIIGDLGNSGTVNYPSITSSDSNIYVSFYDASTNSIWFVNSTNAGATWTQNYTINTTSTTGEYPSISLDSTNPIVFWQNSTSNQDIVYRDYTGSAWSTVAAVTTDHRNNIFVNTKWNYSGNCIEFVYMNGTSSPYNITYAALGTCTSP
jgi:hypothetical protein